MGNRVALRTGESWAIKPDAIQRDADGFFFMSGPESPENERVGTVAVVHVRGALAHYDTGCGDSYEAILKRVSAALACEPKPSAVLFRIESPGGVVAGLNECVRKLQTMSKASGARFIAFVDEMAASAAYALCCACEEILAPQSAVIGSIGTISTMVSTARQDDMLGLDFRIITSGKRKADGHLHVPITDDAVAAESRRNAQLASQFFELAGKARGVSPKKLESLEAAIFLGKEAESVGLIDDVMTYDDVVRALDQTDTGEPPVVAPNNGNVTDRRAEPEATASVSLDKPERSGTVSALAQNGTREDPMSVKLESLIRKAEAAIASESDLRKRVALEAKLSALRVAKAEMDDDGDEDDEDDDDSKAKKAAAAAEKAKRKAEATKHKARAAEFKKKAAEAEEEAKKAEEDDDEEAEARYSEEDEARVAGAAAAVASSASQLPDAVARIEALEKSAKAREQKAMIDEALASRRITPGEAKTLAKKDMGFVQGFLDMRPHAIVNIDENALPLPDGTPNADLGADVIKSIETAIAAANLPPEKEQSMREAMVKAHRDRRAQSNGAGTRY